jgi:DNA-binding transcriptional ArsR family regulator
MKPSEVQFALNLQALASPQCRMIVKVLIKGPQTPQELSKACKLTLTSIAKHLEILVSANLVKVRNLDGANTAYLQRAKFEPTIDWFITLNS